MSALHAAHARADRYFLTASAMLRAVRDGTPWPQEKTSRRNDQGVLRASGPINLNSNTTAS